MIRMFKVTYNTAQSYNSNLQIKEFLSRVTLSLVKQTLFILRFGLENHLVFKIAFFQVILFL